jgi:signal peptidase I
MVFMQPKQQPQIPNQPLQRYPAETPQPVAKSRYPWLRDLIGLLLFIVAVFTLAAIINATVFQSFSVVGPSMEDTLYTGERIIVNRLPVTWAAVSGQEYTPDRGQIIVFKNPQFKPGDPEEYIVKRVVAFSGEKISVENCKVAVYNNSHPEGFDPYQNFDVNNRNDCVTGRVEKYTVPEHEIFVIGDHRNGYYSHDSRDGIGNGDSSDHSPAAIPLSDVVGPVSILLMPLDKFKIF